jgi:hypothetical protein
LVDPIFCKGNTKKKGKMEIDTYINLKNNLKK